VNDTTGNQNDAVISITVNEVSDGFNPIILAIMSQQPDSSEEISTYPPLIIISAISITLFLVVIIFLRKREIIL
jgi:hypothetical protein